MIDRTTVEHKNIDTQKKQSISLFKQNHNMLCIYIRM